MLISPTLNFTEVSYIDPDPNVNPGLSNTLTLGGDFKYKSLSLALQAYDTKKETPIRIERVAPTTGDILRAIKCRGDTQPQDIYQGLKERLEQRLNQLLKEDPNLKPPTHLLTPTTTPDYRQATQPIATIKCTEKCTINGDPQTIIQNIEVEDDPQVYNILRRYNDPETEEGKCSLEHLLQIVYNGEQYGIGTAKALEEKILSPTTLATYTTTCTIATLACTGITLDITGILGTITGCALTPLTATLLLRLPIEGEEEERLVLGPITTIAYTTYTQTTLETYAQQTKQTIEKIIQETCKEEKSTCRRALDNELKEILGQLEEPENKDTKEIKRALKQLQEKIQQLDPQKLAQKHKGLEGEQLTKLEEAVEELRRENRRISRLIRRIESLTNVRGALTKMKGKITQREAPKGLACGAVGAIMGTAVTIAELEATGDIRPKTIEITAKPPCKIKEISKTTIKCENVGRQ